jgi:uncharacterized membrane protein YfcA
MESASGFLGVPGVDARLFFELAAASFATTMFGVIVGTAGGLVLLAIMAFVFPPAILLPVHTFIQLGAGASRAVILWRWVMRPTVLPFTVGAVVGAALGARIFVSLPEGVLQGILGFFILIVTWLPRFGRLGSERNRFALLGAAATFLGIFVSATGTLVAPFVLSASPDRRNHIATLATLMSIVHTIKLVAFAALGFAVGAYLPLVVAMIATASLGSWVGALTLDRIPERVFRLVLQAILTVLALRLIWIAAGAPGG